MTEELKVADHSADFTSRATLSVILTKLFGSGPLVPGFVEGANHHGYFQFFQRKTEASLGAISKPFANADFGIWFAN